MSNFEQLRSSRGSYSFEKRHDAAVKPVESAAFVGGELKPGILPQEDKGGFRKITPEHPARPNEPVYTFEPIKVVVARQKWEAWVGDRDITAYAETLQLCATIR